MSGTASTTSPPPREMSGDFSRGGTAVSISLGDPSTMTTPAKGGFVLFIDERVTDFLGTRFDDSFNIAPGQGGFRFDGGDGRDRVSLYPMGYRDADIEGLPGAPWGRPAGYVGTGTGIREPLGSVSVEGTTVLLGNVERMDFLDGIVFFDTASRYAQVHRLYQAALDRAPDPAGLGDWVRKLEGERVLDPRMGELLVGGAPLKTLAQGFLGSAEFTARFPAAAGPDHGAFVDQLYLNVLGRPGDAEGRANWVGALQAGTLDRADALLGFSESPEHVGLTRFEVHRGVWLVDREAAQIARLYDTVLGRLPDREGLAAWKAAMEGFDQTPLVDVAKAMAASPEFQSRYGALGDGAFAAALYRNALDREPDAGGLQEWTEALRAGKPRAEVVVGFSESPEHVALMAPKVDNGVWMA